MTTFAWHVHHDVLVEHLTEPIEVRAAYIRKHKPSAEIALRLRLLQPVQDALPAEILEAQAIYEKALDAYATAKDALWKAASVYDEIYHASGTAQGAAAERSQIIAAFMDAGAVSRKVWDNVGAARATYEDAITVNMPALLALHAIECPDCPWDGKTIFPKETAQ